MARTANARKATRKREQPGTGKQLVGGLIKINCATSAASRRVPRLRLMHLTELQTSFHVSLVAMSRGSCVNSPRNVASHDSRALGKASRVFFRQFKLHFRKAIQFSGQRYLPLPKNQTNVLFFRNGREFRAAIGAEREAITSGALAF